MAKRSELFDLIKSLTKSEKRYFRLYTSLHTKGDINKYAVLFDLIDRQSAYDEAAVRREFLRESGPSHFAEAKHYLYQSIVKALHLYHLERSVDSRIQMLIHQAEILYDKKLYDQFERMLSKALDLSVAHSRNVYTLDILSLQYRSIILEQSSPGVVGRMEAMFGKMTTVAGQILNHTQHWHLHARMYFLSRLSGTPRTEEELQRYRDIMNDELLQDESRALTPLAKVYFYLNHTLYYEAVQNYGEAAACQKKMIGLIHSNPLFLDPPFKMYIPALYNMCLFAAKAGHIDELFHYHALLVEQTAKQSGHEGLRTHIQALTLLPGVYVHTGDFDRALAGLNAIEEAMERYRGKHRLGMREQIDWLGFRVYFGLERYDRCLQYLNALLDRRNAEAARDLYYAARLAFLIVHFELRNYDLLEYLMKSTYKYFLSRRRIYRFETVILGFLRRVLKNPSTDMTDHFRRLYDEVVPLQNDPFENVPFDHFEYPVWIESKLRNTSFAELLREKNGGCSASVGEEADSRATDN